MALKRMQKAMMLGKSREERGQSAGNAREVRGQARVVYFSLLRILFSTWPAFYRRIGLQA